MRRGAAEQHGKLFRQIARQHHSQPAAQIEILSVQILAPKSLLTSRTVRAIIEWLRRLDPKQNTALKTETGRQEEY